MRLPGQGFPGDGPGVAMATTNRERGAGRGLEPDAATGATDPALRRVRAVSSLLDSSIRVPGTDYRVGLDPILGILPGVGDSVATLISLYIVLEAVRADVPASTLLRMLLYVGVDAVIGSIPVLGTVFDAAWKANEWNARLLASHLEDQRATAEATG